MLYPERPGHTWSPAAAEQRGGCGHRECTPRLLSAALCGLLMVPSIRTETRGQRSWEVPERGPSSQAWDGRQKEKHWGLNGKVLGGEGRVPGGLPVSYFQ